MVDQSEEMKSLLEQKKALTKSLSNSAEWKNRLNARRALHESQVYKEFTVCDQAVKDMEEYSQRAHVMALIKDLRVLGTCYGSD